MEKLKFSSSKTLKLTNVLRYKVLLQDENLELQTVIEQMQSYIRIKGARQIGPLIQYTKVFLEGAECRFEMDMMLQCDKFLHNVEQPYTMDSVIRVPDALYCRYTGSENTLKFAYDKINVEAFENDIKLGDCNYTIFVDKNVEDDTLIADVFVPKAESI